MAASKFLALVSGRIKEIVATVTSAGVADDGKIVALDSTGRLDTSVLPVGIGASAAELWAYSSRSLSTAPPTAVEIANATWAHSFASKLLTVAKFLGLK